MRPPPKPSPEIVIEPTRGLSLGLGPELFAYRDLLWLFVWRDIADPLQADRSRAPLARGPAR